MVRHAIQEQDQDREAERTKQEVEDHFGVHLICFAFRQLEKPKPRNAKEKHYSRRYQRVRDHRHGLCRLRLKSPPTGGAM
jgi:hypothetical protein